MFFKSIKIISLALSLFGSPFALSANPFHGMAASIDGEERYGSKVYFQVDDVRLAVQPDGHLSLDVGKHHLSVQFLEIRSRKVCISNCNGEITEQEFQTGPDGTAKFSSLQVEDPFLSFFRALDEEERSKVESFKNFIVDYCSGKPNFHSPRQSLSDCHIWTMFALTSFTACPGTMGLGCMAGAYGLMQQLRNC